jgi:hypothetical protein
MGCSTVCRTVLGPDAAGMEWSALASLLLSGAAPAQERDCIPEEILSTSSRSCSLLAR